MAQARSLSIGDLDKFQWGDDLKITISYNSTSLMLIMIIQND